MIRIYTSGLSERHGRRGTSFRSHILRNIFYQNTTYTCSQVLHLSFNTHLTLLPSCLTKSLLALISSPSPGTRPLDIISIICTRLNVVLLIQSCSRRSVPHGSCSNRRPHITPDCYPNHFQVHCYQCAKGTTYQSVSFLCSVTVRSS